MKKLLSLILALALCASLFGVLAEESSPLSDARSYLYMMYKSKPETTPTDYSVVGVLNIDGVEYPIVWTADSETVKIIPQDNKMVTIDVDEQNPEEITYVLTATITDETGATETVSFTHKVPAAMILEGKSYAEIVDAAYQLEAGLGMDGTFRLYGTVTAINTPWSPDYQNITVTIQVGDLEDKPIQCYRLKGEGAENLAVGDKITVEGILKNYKGTIEFDSGCVLVPAASVNSIRAAVKGYALEEGLAATGESTMTGVISAINTAWSDDYQNITVTIVPGNLEDYAVQCYRLKGDGAKDLAVGDTITVTGTLKNYKGTIEFDSGCQLVEVVK